MSNRILLGVLVSWCFLPSVVAQPADDPEIERRAFKVLDGLDVSCFASEPMIANPIQMDFDPQGRLWVVTAPAYPHYVPGEKPDDKLVVLEDTDGDGKADKRTVFADGLYVPTGFALGDGGVYISNQPDLYFMKDTDGDGKADERRILFSGFGTEDNHHAIHSYRWGPDGWLYIQSGIFLHNQVETAWGMRRRADGVMWRLKPRAQRLEFQVRSMDLCNPWGHAFDRWGQDFWSEAPGGPLCHVALGTADGVAPQPYPHSRLPKTCGIEFVESRHFPEDWQGDLIVNAFKNRVVHRYRMSDDGASFAAKELEPLIQSTEEFFRPVDAKFGPDGALYIADWYNPIIGHMQYNFRDPRRDHTHGRIWKVTFKGRPLLMPPRLAGVPLPELLDHLKSPEAYNRHMARRVLYDMDPKAVVPALAAWVKALDPADPEVEHHRLEALWAYQTIDRADEDGELLDSVLASKDPRARAAATRVVRDAVRFGGPGEVDPGAALCILVDRVADDHPRVRLEAVTALSWIKTPLAADLALSLLDRPMDRYLDYALKMTAVALKDQWLPGLQAGTVPFGGNARHLEYALQAVGTKNVVEPLLGMLREGKVSAENRTGIFVLLAQLGGPGELRAVLDEALRQPSGSEAYRGVPLLAALATAARVRKVVPEGDLTGIKALFHAEHEHGVASAEALRLAGVWKLESLRPDIVGRLALVGEKRDPVRRAAVDALAELGGPASVELLRELCAANRPAPIRMIAAAGLAELDPGAAAPLAAAVLAAVPPDADPADLFTAFLRRKGGSEALAAALDGAKIPPAVAQAGLDTLNAAGRSDAALLNILRSAVGATHASPLRALLPPGATALPPEEMQKLIAEVKEKGDPAHGEQVFRRKEMQCFACHAISGAGGNVAPDLNNIGTGSTIDYLVEAVLFPAKAVREGFQSIVVTTKDELVYTGVVSRRTEQALVLRDATHDEIVIPKADIAEEKDAGSIMPTGLTDGLTRREFLDLIRFLSELGRPGPYAARNVPVVRRWEVLEEATPRISRRKANKHEVLPAPPRPELAPRGSSTLRWRTVYSTVSGSLSLNDLPVLDPSGKRVTVVACDLEVTNPGSVRLRLNSNSGIDVMWATPVGGFGPGVYRANVLQAADGVELNLAEGSRRIIFDIWRSVRSQDLRVEFEDIPGSPTRFRVVNGK